MKMNAAATEMSVSGSRDRLNGLQQTANLQQ